MDGEKSTGKCDQHHSSLFKGMDILKIKSVTIVHLLETQKQTILETLTTGDGME